MKPINIKMILRANSWFILGLIILGLFIKPINIKSFENNNNLINSSVVIQVGESSSKLNYKLDYQSFVYRNIIDQINFDFPFTNLKDLKVSSNGQDIPFNLSQTTKTKSVSVKLSSSLTSFQTNPTLNISFETSDLLKDYPLGKYLYLPSFLSDFQIQEMGFQVVYPSEFNKPTKIYSRNYNLADNQISGLTTGGILIAWQDSKILNLKISNKIPPAKSSLINLPIEDNYEIVYKINPTFQYGLVDSLGNKFGVVDDLAKLDFDLDLNFVDSEGSIDLKPNLYNLIDLSSEPIFQNVLQEAKQFVEKIDQLNYINNFLVNKLNFLMVEEVNVSQLPNLTQKVLNNNNLNSFEYCYLLNNLLSTLEIPTQIVYGYTLIPDFQETKTTRVWCEAEINNQIYTLDPWLEDIFKITLLDKRSNDRMVYGIWNNSSSNNMLGLSSNDSENQTISFFKTESIPNQNVNQNLKVTFPQTLIGGALNRAGLLVENSGRFKKIDILKLNNNIISIKYKDYELALAPNSLNTFDREFYSGDYLIFTSGKRFQTELATSNTLLINETSIDVTANSNLASFSIISIVLTLIFGWIVLKRDQIIKLLTLLKNKYTV